MTLTLPLDARKLAFGFVYALLTAAVFAGGYLLNKGVGYTTYVDRPLYCGAKQMTSCIDATIEASGASVVKNSCAKAAKGTYACDLEIAGTYGPQCFDVTVKRAKQGFPLVETAAEKTCP